MPTLRQLSYLVALADEQHFRRAAERVHVTQPTLSAQLQTLERRLEVKLVERGSHQVTLTPLGREIASRARKVLGDVQEIIDLAASSQHGLYGTVRLGVPSTLGPYLLPYIVPELHTRYPDLKLYVKEGKPKDLQEQLLAGDFDVLLLPVPITQKELTVELLFREPLLVTVARDHPLATRKDITRSDLAGESVLTIEQGHHLHEYVRTICEDLDATLLRDYEGTSLDTVRIMAGMGVGIAFLPSLYVRSEIGSRQEVVVLDVKGLNVHRQIGLAWRKGSVNALQFNGIAELMREVSTNRLPEVTVIR